MAESKLPYINAYGNVTKVLEKIQGAATPDRFYQDFLADTLGMKGGSPRPVIPYLKRTGFLGADGIPTPLYTSFRNQRCGLDTRPCSRWPRLRTLSMTRS